MVDGSLAATGPLHSLSARRVRNQIWRMQIFSDGGGQTHSRQLLQLNVAALLLTLAEFDSP
jgi:hypothetical protein